MSMITRCPACSTLFKVVPDQLRISEGWVKCGQCSEIFNASQHLISEQVEATLSPEPETDPSEQKQADTEPRIEMDTPGVPDDVEPVAGTPEFAELAPIGNGETQADSFLGSRVELSEVESAVSQASLPPVNTTEIKSNETSDESFPEAAAPDQLSFMQQRGSVSVWSKPPGRAGLIIAAVTLCSGLLFQWLYFERNRLAVDYPAMKPPLQSLCSLLNCAISPLQSIESIVIDSAAFNKLSKDSFRLSFTIKNRSSNEVAMPDLELTLTDSEDKPIVRRVLSHAELGAQSDVLMAGKEWPVSTALSVKADATMPRVVGYRLMVFYP